MKEAELHKLLENLVCQPDETEWIEFKVDYQTLARSIPTTIQVPK